MQRGERGCVTRDAIGVKIETVEVHQIDGKCGECAVDVVLVTGSDPCANLACNRARC